MAVVPEHQGFVPGVYRHYKGGTYTAVTIAKYHDSEEWFVVYVSHANGATAIRELASPGRDSWTDVLDWPDGEKRPRFVYVGNALSDN